jgi:nucleotide-binding universal stress UspA family protein
VSELLFVAVHGHSRLRELLLDSTALTILDASEITVFLVR